MRRTLLIVDDHAGFRAVARMTMAGPLFTVVGTAADGGSAVAMAEALSPAVVLLDVNLPDMDGFAVSERLARLPRPPAVVLTSSRTLADLGRRLTESSASGFVGKGDLSAEAVAEVLDR